MTFGESHGPLIGVVIDGVRSGVEIDVHAIQQELDKRKPGQSALTTQRVEQDQCEVVSGVFEGKTTGAPLCILIHNTDQRSRDYSAIKNVFRPGHASWTWLQKYGMFDYRGGGRASGRETAMRVAAGAVARQLLPSNVVVHAGTVAVADVVANERNWETVELNPVRCPDPTAAVAMAMRIDEARKQGDSVGGVIEIVVQNVPVGWGEPVYEKLESELARAVMSVGAVKGVEFGDGFASTLRNGSENNDQMIVEDNSPTFLSNHAGGILGGVSSGADIVLRVAVKPTSSVSKEQQTVTTEFENTTMSTQGRHDPCICPRIVPVLSAMVVLVLCDMYLKQQQRTEGISRADAILHAAMLIASSNPTNHSSSPSPERIRELLEPLSLEPSDLEKLLSLL